MPSQSKLNYIKSNIKNLHSEIDTLLDLASEKFEECGDSECSDISAEKFNKLIKQEISHIKSAQRSIKSLKL